MILIGLVGGVASGKSLVSGRLASLGARVLDADRIGHEVLREEAVKDAVRERWGDHVFGADGEIDRPSVARIVFAADPESHMELTFLESLTHPRIGQRLSEQLALWSCDQGNVVAVLDAPVMLKSGWDEKCDTVVFVDASRDARLARARRRGWSEAEFLSREAAQQTLEAKRRRADVVIDNSTTLEHLYAQVDRFWLSLEP
jgi:dephospho-CoA kinase